MMESFPGAEGTRRDRRWQTELVRGACAGSYPSQGDPHCETPDGFCETAELSTYESADADCFVVDGARYGLLFYRSESTSFGTPCAVLSSPSEGLVARCEPATDIPTVMRVHRDANRERTRVWLSTAGDGHFSLDESAEGVRELTAAAAIEWLGEQLIQKGMTPGERDAFLRAWTIALFGDEAPVTGQEDHGELLGVAADALLYFLPSGVVDAELPLEFDPPPTSVSRAFLVRVDLARLVQSTR
jgi:hypothetical protein